MSTIWTIRCVGYAEVGRKLADFHGGFEGDGFRGFDGGFRGERFGGAAAAAGAAASPILDLLSWPTCPHLCQTLQEG